MIDLKLMDNFYILFIDWRWKSFCILKKLVICYEMFCFNFVKLIVVKNVVICNRENYNVDGIDM